MRSLLGDYAVTDYPPNPVYYDVDPETAAFSTRKSHYIHGKYMIPFPILVCYTSI